MREGELIGLQSDIGNFNGFSVTALASGRFGAHIEEQAVEYTALPVDIDATIVTAYSDKNQAAPAWKKSFGFHR